MSSQDIDMVEQAVNCLAHYSASYNEKNPPVIIMLKGTYIIAN